jgi:hypothetical protein
MWLKPNRNLLVNQLAKANWNRKPNSSKANIAPIEIADNFRSIAVSFSSRIKLNKLQCSNKFPSPISMP